MYGGLIQEAAVTQVPPKNTQEHVVKRGRERERACAKEPSRVQDAAVSNRWSVSSAFTGKFLKGKDI